MFVIKMSFFLDIGFLCNSHLEHLDEILKIQ